MLFPNPDMLFYIAMADAYAAAVEYNRKLRDECLKFQRYFNHPTHGLWAGAYTDDTEMSVANAKVLIRYYGENFTPLMFADAYVGEFQRGGRRKGYSKEFQKILEKVNFGLELLAELKNDSVQNGAAMRSVPFGVLPTIEQVLEVSTLQACITHSTPEGRFSARVVALMSHASLYEDLPLTDLGRYCKQHLPQEDLQRFGYVFDNPWSGGEVKKSLLGASVAITTVHAVVDVLAREKSLMDILKRVIIWGGDTDSVAAIAWGIASARYQKEVLPVFMKRDLEGPGKDFERKHLQVMGILLMNKYK